MANASVRKKESRRTRLYELLGRAKRPLRFVELVVAYARRYSEDVGGHEALSSALGALLHSGEVTRVGRGRGIVRYRLVVRSPRSKSTRRPRQELVWEVVDQAYRETKAPVSTAEIRRRLKARGAWPDRFLRLVSMLDAMVVDPTDASVVSTRAARTSTALRRAPAAPSRGRVPGFWVPAWAPPQCAVAAPNATDALRYAISAATREAGMPVSQRELRWWIAARPPESWWRRELSPSRTGAALRNVALRDRGRHGESDAVSVVEGPLTCHGGAPKRYTVGAPGDAAIRACHITDAVTMLELDVEIATRALLLGLGLPAGARRGLEGARLTAVRAALLTYCGRLDSRELARAHRWRTRAMRAVASWHAAATRAETSAILLRSELRQELARWHAMKEIVRQLEMQAPRRSEPGTTALPCIVGRTALVSLERAIQHVERARAKRKFIAARPELVFSVARRFPPLRASNRDEIPSRRLVAGGELAQLDAVDVWYAVRRRAAPDGISSTVGANADIVALVGPVLRDAALIKALLARQDFAVNVRRLLLTLLELFRGRLPAKS